METLRLLIVEDDPGLQNQMKWCFEGVEVFTASNAVEAEAVLRKETPQVITLDLGLPPDPGGASVGFEFLALVSDKLPATKVIIVTGREEREYALQAIGLGAYDFYQKPIDSEPLRFVVDRAFRLWQLEEENRRLATENHAPSTGGMITGDPAMISLGEQAERIASSDVSVLILGETGTGKEVIAKLIHDHSDRADAPFVVINCAAIPENLLESELFGHEKGAFTGAVGRKIGKIEAANHGTLFLDEIGDMPLPLQVKILRFLEGRSIERVGSNQSIDVDVRVVSATHRSLSDMQASGEFREDLFFRVGEISLTLPPLRERPGDAEILARAFASQYAPGDPPTFSPQSLRVITQWRWPGNVRELKNRVKRACIMSENNIIFPHDLDLDDSDTGHASADPLNLKEVRAAAERGAIIKALERAEYNISQAARLLGVSRPTLYNLLQKYDVADVGESN